jgi:hypothetical protein
MTFEQLCDRLTSLFDVSQSRAVEVSNERLSRMVGEAKSLRSLVNIGTTVASQATYALAATIVQVYRVSVPYSSGTVTYAGTETLDMLMDITSGTAESRYEQAFYAVQPDADALQTTNNLYLSPAPSEAGKTITGICAILPATLTYASATALPIPLDLHTRLLAGCKAELSDEESRQDEAAKHEAVFEFGVRKLEARANSLARGSDRHRMRLVGYDTRR